MNEEKIITPQIVYVDEQNRIKGITSAELGVEVITEYNCSYALTEDGIAFYKYENGEVIERTEAEIEADRANVPEPPESIDSRMNDVEDAVLEVANLVAENEISIADLTDAILELADIITGEK